MLSIPALRWQYPAAIKAFAQLADETALLILVQQDASPNLLSFINADRTRFLGLIMRYSQGKP